MKSSNSFKSDGGLSGQEKNANVKTELMIVFGSGDVWCKFGGYKRKENIRFFSHAASLYHPDMSSLVWWKKKAGVKDGGTLNFVFQDMRMTAKHTGRHKGSDDSRFSSSA